jgi:sarcosine oxidase subunit beta
VRTADVAVVGAGAVGLAVAVELRRVGVEHVLVLDRNHAAGMGSTARANGGVRAQFASAINIAFSRYTIAALADLDALTGGQVGLRRNGYLFIAGRDSTARALRRAFELQRALGVRVHWLQTDELAEIAPFVRLNGVTAATFCSDDGIVDPNGVCAALLRVGRSLGVEYLFGCAVRAVEHEGGSTRLRTDVETVDARFVVNAAGPTARALAAMAQIELPVTPYRHNLACTEPVVGIPEGIPMCVDADTGLHIRREGGGVLIGWPDPDVVPGDDDSFDEAFLEAVARHAPHRFPFLVDARIDRRKCWAGLYPQTPDRHAIVDAPAAAPWFIQCAGFGGHGIMHSLAAARAVAELVRDGRCTAFDLRALRADRFEHPAEVTVETAVL